MTICDQQDKIGFISCILLPKNNEPSRNRNRNRNCTATDIKIQSFHDVSNVVFLINIVQLQLIRIKVYYFVHHQRCFCNIGVM